MYCSPFLVLLLTIHWYLLYSHRKSTLVGKLYWECLMQNFLCFRLVGTFLRNTKHRALFILEDEDSFCGYCVGAFDSRVFNDQSNQWFAEVGVVHLSVNYFVIIYYIFSIWLLIISFWILNLSKIIIFKVLKSFCFWVIDPQFSQIWLFRCFWSLSILIRVYIFYCILCRFQANMVPHLHYQYQTMKNCSFSKFVDQSSSFLMNFIRGFLHKLSLTFYQEHRYYKLTNDVMEEGEVTNERRFRNLKHWIMNCFIASLVRNGRASETCHY